ncbi:hypothetical protein FRC11_012671 [Ceratobasidium sp. 423]|nr:hypothetical protein FRC11_012671 [Ceratobasidium sp. 423]
MVRSMRSNENLTPSKSREFRVDAQLAPNGRTLLLTRYSNRPRQMINQGDTGYGANFERAATSEHAPMLIPSYDQSGRRKFTPTSYHRIVKYSLSDLNLLVRYEVDAAQPAPSLDNSPIPGQASLEQKRVEIQPHSTLRHIVSGSLIPQDRIIELKTGTSSGKLKWYDSHSFQTIDAGQWLIMLLLTFYRTHIRPQLYFSQTPILKVGIHKNGKFSEVEKHTIDQNYDGRAVESNQDLVGNLSLLVPVLKQMKHACQQHGRSGKPLAFFWSGAGPLQLYEIKHPKRSHNLPKDILESL